MFSTNNSQGKIILLMCFLPGISFLEKPKGPFRTKNTTAIAKIVNYYAVVFLLRPPNLVRRGPFLVRKNVCNSQEIGVRTRRTAIVNHPAVLKILRVVNLLHVVFLVRRGPLGACQICESIRLARGAKIHRIGKRGFRSRTNPIRKGVCRVKKILNLHRGHYRKLAEFFDSNHPFSGVA